MENFRIKFSATQNLNRIKISSSFVARVNFLSIVQVELRNRRRNLFERVTIEKSTWREADISAHGRAVKRRDLRFSENQFNSG